MHKGIFVGSNAENRNERILILGESHHISKTDDKLIVIWLDFEEGEDKYTDATCGEFEDLNEAKCLSAATVSQGFSSNVIIQGNFTEEQVKDLVDLINSGSLPSKLSEVSSQTVGATFGDQTLEKTLLAGIIGIALIIVILIAIYHFAGFVAK